MDDEPFNPDYVEVDRVLDVSTGVDHHTGEVRIILLLLLFMLLVFCCSSLLM